MPVYANLSMQKEAEIMTAEKRLAFSIACTDRKLSGKIVMAYTDQMKRKTDEEKERMAEAFTKEIKEKYPLPKKDEGDR